MTDDTPEYVRALAKRFGIADADALDEALADADYAGEVAHFEWLGLAYQSDDDVPQHARLTKLLAALQAEFENMMPITWFTAAAALRKELRNYADWLATMPARPRPKQSGRPADGRSRAFVVTLAQHWTTLTGESPAAWRDNITGEPGGRFYELLEALWPEHWAVGCLPWVTFPSPTTVHRWLNIHNS